MYIRGDSDTYILKTLPIKCLGKHGYRSLALQAIEWYSKELLI